jgi:hypothetical protein
VIIFGAQAIAQFSVVAPHEIVKRYIETQREPPPIKQIKKSLALSGRKRPSSLTHP